MKFKNWFSKPVFTADVHISTCATDASISGEEVSPDKFPLVRHRTHVSEVLSVIEEIRHDEFPLIFKFLDEAYFGWSRGRGELYIPVGQGYVVGIPRAELRRAAELPIEKIPTLNKYSPFNVHMREFFMWRLKEGL